MISYFDDFFNFVPSHFHLPPLKHPDGDDIIDFWTDCNVQAVTTEVIRRENDTHLMRT